MVMLMGLVMGRLGDWGMVRGIMGQEQGVREVGLEEVVEVGIRDGVLVWVSRSWSKESEEGFREEEEAEE